VIKAYFDKKVRLGQYKPQYAKVQPGLLNPPQKLPVGPEDGEVTNPDAVHPN
jgi:hypothetical protein